MAKADKFYVHCMRPNASALINGIAFAAHDDGGVRTVEPVDGDIADQFTAIPGFTAIPVKAKKDTAPATTAAPDPVVPPAPSAPVPDAPITLL